MIYTGVTRRNTTCLPNNTTYNAGTQQWTCNICSRTERPQDTQNMTRHILWHKKNQVGKQENTTYYIHTRTPNRNASPISTKPTMQENPTPEPPAVTIPLQKQQNKNNKHGQQTIWGYQDMYNGEKENKSDNARKTSARKNTPYRKIGPIDGRGCAKKNGITLRDSMPLL